MFSGLSHLPLKFLSLTLGRLRSTVFPKLQIGKALTSTLFMYGKINNHLQVKIHTVLGAERDP